MGGGRGVEKTTIALNLAFILSKNKSFIGFVVRLIEDKGIGFSFGSNNTSSGQGNDCPSLRLLLIFLHFRLDSFSPSKQILIIK